MVLKQRFQDRAEAGRAPAEELSRRGYANRSDLLVLALPRGRSTGGLRGWRVLRAPLDIFIVRKLGVPGHEELAMGAIASDGVRVINDNTVRVTSDFRIRLSTVSLASSRPSLSDAIVITACTTMPYVRGRTVLLIDDGLATGSTDGAQRQLKRSTWAPTGGSSMPYCSCSFSCQPAPTPSTRRPSLMASTVAAQLATTAGWR